MTKVAPWVQEFVKKHGGGTIMAVGKTLKHPDGRTVRITGGQYWGTYGVSNFWYWVEVKPDGTEGPEEHGYGWC